MAKRSHEQAVADAIKVLQVLFEKTDAENGLAWSALEEELSKKEVQRDYRFVTAVVDGARAAGLPVDRPHERGTASKGYRVTGRRFEEWEVGFLADAVQCSRSLSRQEKAALRGKLAHLLPEQCVPHVMRDIVSGPQTEAYSMALSTNLKALNEAISKSRQVSFDYWEYNADGKRTLRESSSKVPVDPYVFVYKNEAYYLIAGKECEGEIQERTYRVDRMSDIVVLDTMKASSIADLKVGPQEQLAASFGMHLRSDLSTVELAFEGNLSKLVAERFGPETVKPADGGRGKAKVKIALSSAFYAWVAQFGGRMSIASPQEAIDEYRDLLCKALSVSPDA